MILNFIFSWAIVGPRPIQGLGVSEMIVCHCRALSDRAIREVIRRGAHSPREVVLACQAGRSCGGCIPAVRELIASETARRAPENADLPVAAAG